MSTSTGPQGPLGGGAESLGDEPGTGVSAAPGSAGSAGTPAEAARSVSPARAPQSPAVSNSTSPGSQDRPSQSTTTSAEHDTEEQEALQRESGQRTKRSVRPSALALLTGGLLLFLVAQRWLATAVDSPALSAFTTIFLSIVLQATPFLVLGVLLSAAITAFVSPAAVRRALPKNPALAVPVAGSAGLVLPGCECASVPVAGGMMARGVAPAAALTFLLAAPAINPIVLAATWVAFPNNPEMMWARLVASLAAAVIMGWLWLALGRGEWIRMPDRSHLAHENPWVTFHRSASHDFLHAGGFLIVGGLTAAVINVVIPTEWVDSLAGRAALSVLALALLAVVMCICSEADAFVAASLSQFSRTAQLAFMVVGPMVDLKLIAMQVGAFGRTFAARFAPATFVVALCCAAVVGGVLL